MIPQRVVMYPGEISDTDEVIPPLQLETCSMTGVSLQKLLASDREGCLRYDRVLCEILRRSARDLVVGLSLDRILFSCDGKGILRQDQTLVGRYPKDRECDW